jgi:CheY-like chemotaxis protein
MEQVIVNLALNARDAMESGGTLTIETANATLDVGYSSEHPEVTPGEYVMIAVSDTGGGMDAETVANVFEPFFTTKSHRGGSGLGLATSYGMIKQCGGSLFVYSEVGGGTTFKAYLPRSYAEPRSLKAPKESVPKSGHETLLLVEDDARVRSVAERTLSAQGYQVIAAADPEEARAAFERLKGRIDALVTDVVLPTMTGKELAELFRQRRPGLPVLYTSGYTENTIVHRGIVDEDVNFLPKPYIPTELAKRVREVLDNSVPESEHKDPKRSR